MKDKADKGALMIRILRELRGEVKESREALSRRLDATNARLDQHIEHTDERFDQVMCRIVESEVRTATAITALASDVREVASLLRGQSDLRPRVERCEDEITALKRRMP